MKPPKLERLLLSFSLKEWKAFEIFLKSPYFNVPKSKLKLFQVIYEGYKKKPGTFPDEQWVWAAYHEKKIALKNEKAIKTKVHNMYSKLLPFARNFLAFEAYKLQEKKQKVNLLKTYRKRGLKDFFKEASLDFDTLMGNSTNWNIDDWHDNYEAAIERDRVFKNDKPLKRDLSNVFTALDTYYLLARLKHSCTLLDREGHLETNINPIVTEAFLTYYKTFEQPNNKLFILYAQTLNMLSKFEDSSQFQLLKVMLDRDGQVSVLGKREIHSLYDFLMNYCNKKINQGVSNYRTESLSLFKIMLAKGIILTNKGNLDFRYYKNIFKIALGEKEHKWAAQFNENYKERIVSMENGKGVYGYNQALACFYHHQFSEALQKIGEIEETGLHPYIKLDFRMLKLKCAYELAALNGFQTDTIDIEKMVANFYALIARKKDFKPTTRKLYAHFLNVVDKLVKTPSFEEKKLAKLALKVQQAEISGKTWLLDKLHQKQQSRNT